VATIFCHYGTYDEVSTRFYVVQYGIMVWYFARYFVGVTPTITTLWLTSPSNNMARCWPWRPSQSNSWQVLHTLTCFRIQEEYWLLNKGQHHDACMAAAVQLITMMHAWKIAELLSPASGWCCHLQLLPPPPAASHTAVGPIACSHAPG
jgi:hypothetical protein